MPITATLSRKLYETFGALGANGGSLAQFEATIVSRLESTIEQRTAD